MISSTPPRVLVIDDDAAFRRLVADALEDQCFRVVEGSDSQATWALFDDDDFAFDVVIADANTTDLPALHVARRLRVTPRAWYTRLVLVSSFAGQALRDEARRIGVSTVLAKPFPLAELVAAVRSITATR